MATVATHLGREVGDPLEYFLEFVVPEFEARDAGEDADAADERRTKDVVNPDSHSIAEDAYRNMPLMGIPTPSLFILGRYWLLASSRTGRTDSPPEGRTHVTFGDSLLMPTGEYMQESVLVEEWEAEIDRHAQNTAALLRDTRRTDRQRQRLEHRRRAFERGGFIVEGGLVLISGTPPMLGHLLPRHRNRSLGREIGADHAIVSPFLPPFAPNSLSVYGRRRAGWTKVSLPHGICLGKGPTNRKGNDPFQDCHALGLAAYLRWAAIRVATNQSFHEHDL
jgi:hypothetical protein